jgi:putative oxidoreductase
MKKLLFSGPGGASPVADVGLLVLRLTGLMLAIGHGWSKITNPGMMAGMLEKIGMPAPHLLAWLAAIGEFGGGLLLTLGLLTRFGAFLVVAVMSVALIQVHLHDPLFTPMTGGGAKEPALLYLLPALTLLFTGAGRFSLDAIFRGDRVRSEPTGFPVESPTRSP